MNKKAFNFQTFDIPEWSAEMKDWEGLDLNDKEFSKTNFDDASWEAWEQKIPNETVGTIEAYFSNSNKIVSEGVIWFRTSVNIDNINTDYQLIFNDGIDDGDQTYFNGQLVGNSWGWNVNLSMN